MIELRSLALKFNYNPDDRSPSDKSAQLFLLDQTLLPQEEKWLEIQELPQMIEAIQSLRVRGAPLIGVAASLFLARESLKSADPDYLRRTADVLYHARPTAVNLMNCLDKMKAVLDLYSGKEIQKNSPVENDFVKTFMQTALNLFQEDVNLCEQIATNGAELIQDGDSILTHCNTGGLATAGIGTALGVIRKAHEQGKKIHVYIDETRPLLQGGRLTAWELQKLNIPCTLITDNMAAHLMSLGKINKAIVGSDRIAKNGDFANKIGTYGVAVSCHYHKIPFYVAAPFTTVDSQCLSGGQIPIEERRATEVQGASGVFSGGISVNGNFGNGIFSNGTYGYVKWAPENVPVYNPAFDVTPAKLTTAWIMDRGLYNLNDIEKGCFA